MSSCDLGTCVVPIKRKKTVNYYNYFAFFCRKLRENFKKTRLTSTKTQNSNHYKIIKSYKRNESLTFKIS